MGKSLLTTVAGAALIACGSLAMAQRMEGSPGGNRSERQPGAIQAPAQEWSGTVEKKEQRSEHPGAMQSPTQGRSAAEEKKEQRQPGMMEKTPSQGRSATEQNRGGVTEQRSVTSVSISPAQKTQLHAIVTGGELRRAGRVNFNIAVGTRIPSTVTVYDVPESIVEIVPQYRGFEYIVVEDQLVIIDPDTLEIVAVLPV